MHLAERLKALIITVISCGCQEKEGSEKFVAIEEDDVSLTVVAFTRQNAAVID